MGSVFVEQKIEADIYAFVETREDLDKVVESVKNFDEDKFYQYKKLSEISKILDNRTKKEMSLLQSDGDFDSIANEVKKLYKESQEKIDKVEDTLRKKYKEELLIFKCFELDLESSGCDSDEERFLMFRFEYENELEVTKGIPATMWEPAEGGEIIGDVWEYKTIYNYFKDYLRCLEVDCVVYDEDIDYDIDDLDDIYEKATKKEEEEYWDEDRWDYE